MERPHPPFESLAHVIVRRLHAAPDRCAIRFCDSSNANSISITNAALAHKVLLLAGQLREAGIRHGTRTGVCLERGPGTPALLLALWLQGAVYVPLDAALPRDRLFAMCDTAELELLILHPTLQHTLDNLPCPLLVLQPMTFDLPQTPLPTLSPAPSKITANDLAYILFTSGSSGVPKGVKISHGNIDTLFAAIVPLLGLTENCRILGCANVSFDIAFFELLAPLLCGGTLVLADQQTCGAPQRLLHLLEREQVTVVQATPSHWQLLNALPWTSPVALAIATGEALPRTTAAAIQQHARTVWNLYGPTECTLWASAHCVDSGDIAETAPAIVSIGTPLAGYTLQLRKLDTSDGHEDRCAGELLIGGRGVGLGYCGEPAHGPERGHYHSGDLCRYDHNGALHYLGRLDNQVKHNGYRIELDEIALVLQQHMSIRQAVCLVRPARVDANSLLFACVVFRAGMPNRNKKTLNEHLATQLPAWMLPQRYFFLEQLPLTGNGKLDRAALLALTDPVSAQNHNGSLEARVAQVFCDVLDIDGIGPCDSFLDAGGSSMQAATLVLTLNERLGTALTLRQALNTPPTVNSIIQLLRATAATSAAT
jgi:amino acid adenylation domain-containing protein